MLPTGPTCVTARSLVTCSTAQLAREWVATIDGSSLEHYGLWLDYTNKTNVFKRMPDPLSLYVNLAGWLIMAETSIMVSEPASKNREHAFGMACLIKRVIDFAPMWRVMSAAQADFCFRGYKDILSKVNSTIAPHVMLNKVQDLAKIYRRGTAECTMDKHAAKRLLWSRHERLGGESPMAMLDQFTLKEILQISFPPVMIELP